MNIYILLRLISELIVVILFLLLLEVIFEGTPSGVQGAKAFKRPSLLDPRQRNVAGVVFSEKLVDDLVDVGEGEVPVGEFTAQLPIVVVEGLEVAVDVDVGGGEAQVEGTENPDVLVVVVFDELDDNVLVGLDLKHLEDEADEGGGAAVTGVGAPEVVELHGLVDEGLGGEPEALLLPVDGSVDLRPDYLLHQILGVRTPYVPGHRIRPVGHPTRFLTLTGQTKHNFIYYTIF